MQNELDAYLSTDIEDVDDALLWWHKRCHTFPHLSCMALDYLTIPGKILLFLYVLITDMFTHTVATSVNVKHIFSRGHLILSHVHNYPSVQSTRALLCVVFWLSMGFVKDEDVKAVTTMADVEGDDRVMEDGWDDIKV